MAQLLPIKPEPIMETFPPPPEDILEKEIKFATYTAKD
jgi:hypothetical protein